MQKIKTVLLAVLTSFILSACSSNVTYNTDFEKEFDFDGFKTYRWHVPNDANAASQAYLANNITDNRIRKNVGKQMEDKGFILTQFGPVDFLVNYSVITEERVDIRSYNNYGGYAPGWGYGMHAGRGYHRGGFGSRGGGRRGGRR